MTVAVVALAFEGSRAATALVAVAAVVFVVGVAFPRVAAGFDAALARVGAGAARGVGAFLAAVTYVVLAIPLWLLSGLSGYGPLVHGWSTGRSSFVEVGAIRRLGAGGLVSGASRLAGTDLAPAPAVRRRGRLRWVVPAVAVALAVALIPRGSDDLTVVAREIDLRGSADMPVRSGSAPRLDVDTSGFDRSGGTTDHVLFHGYPVTRYSHEHEPWAPTHFRELNAARSQFDFFLAVRPLDVRGRTLNIRDGVRVSYTPKHPTLTVWFFGGSTMYGIGQRDDHTIPSVVARRAEADGVRIRAVNFGVSGDVNWQETQRFAEALTSKRWAKPDLVVFYDGVNDRGLATYRVEAGSIDPAVIDRIPVSNAEAQRWTEDNGGPPDLSGSERLSLEVELASTQYRRGVELGRLLGTAFGVPVIHFWQPYPMVKRLSGADTELFRRFGYSTAVVPWETAIYNEMRERSGVDPIDLSRVLDDVTVPVYFDLSHTNEYGARLVGTALYRRVASKLRKLDSARRRRVDGG